MADITGIGSVADLAATAINRIWPDKTPQEMEKLRGEFALIIGQMEVNKTEAASSSVFVSGWRPFIGWVCGMACAWNWIFLKMTVAAASFWGVELFLAPADLSEMMPVLLGMLGLGALRTVEKTKGVASQ